MKTYSVAFLVYSEVNSARDALTEEKYSRLAYRFIEKGFTVESVIYNDLLLERLYKKLQKYHAILVWVNPIEQGNDRKKLDDLLQRLAAKGNYVSAHPETILKIGTKEVLYTTREMEWGGDIHKYDSFDDFQQRFFNRPASNNIIILKQYRGNGGNGVFKIDITDHHLNKIRIVQAAGDTVERVLSVDAFLEEIRSYFSNNSMLIEQPWNQNIINGMVRCYLTGNRVSGFGYQEINALYPSEGATPKLPGKRFYFTEQCGLFQDLRFIMETEWIPRLLEIAALKSDMLPVIWDADFFINKPNLLSAKEKYSLCEINVSCVSPFPESAIPFIVNEVGSKIKNSITPNIL